MITDKKILETISLIRKVASEEIIPRFGKVKASTKGDFKDFKEYVTEADIKAGEELLKFTRKEFPGSYSEEQLYEERFDYDEIWQFDPVDGTQEFFEKIKRGYAVHAAFLKKENLEYIPKIGIIYLPGTDKLWYNDLSGKVHFIKNGKESEIPNSKREKIRGYFRKVDPNDKIKIFYNELGEKLSLESESVPSYGGGSSISDLLEDKINLIIMNYDYTKEWDLAMAEPLIKAMGGFICDLKGNEFSYNRKDSFNRKGYVISTIFKKEEILPYIKEDLLIKKL